MQKKNRSKEVSGDESLVANRAMGEPSKSETILICVRECEMPFVGFWKVGDKVVDPQTISKIGDNPNFIKEGGE